MLATPRPDLSEVCLTTEDFSSTIGLQDDSFDFGDVSLWGVVEGGDLAMPSWPALSDLGNLPLDFPTR